MASITLGGQEVAVQPMSGRRAIRMAHVIRSIAQSAPEVFDTMTEFVRSYREEHAITLDRARARFEFPTETAQFSEADWEAGGNRLVLPRSPSPLEITAAVFPIALDVAEEQTLMLLAIGVTSNEEVAALKRAGGNDAIDEHLRTRGDALLDEALADELLELAAVMAETAQTQFADKVQDLGERVRPLMRLLGIDRQAQTDEFEPTPEEIAEADERATAAATAAAEPEAGSPESSTEPAMTSASDSDSLEPSAGRSPTPSTVTPGTS